jgi:Ni,Fe-hydrogenase III small subunit
MRTARLLAVRLPAFHLRLGCCGGCGDMVDLELRGRPGGSPVIAVECDSPRHAGLLLVTGIWSPGIAEAALRVIEEAPQGTKVLLVGDCALGRGRLLESTRAARPLPAGLEPYAEISGCPVSAAEIRERIKDVAR